MTDKTKLTEYGQEHLIRFYNELSDEGKKRLEADVASVDFEEVRNIYNSAISLRASDDIDSYEPFPAFVEPEKNTEEYEKYRKAGLKSIENGEIIAVTMGGGMGSRLSFDGPKGAYNIGLYDSCSIFGLEARSLISVSREAGKYIPWFIMTSDITDDATRKFFEDNDYFGYPRDHVGFFSQESIPVTDKNGKILLAEKDKISRAPNGNGGIFGAMLKSGIVDRCVKNGAKYVFVHNVDNVLVKMCDPCFVGYTVLNQKEAVAKTIIKKGPKEKAGVYSLKGGKISIVEYSEVSGEMANAVDDNGNFLFGDVNVGIYLFSLESIKKLGNKGLPYHVAVKKINYIDESGNKIIPEKPNAFKFETFLFDIFEYMKNVSIYRIKREEEFAPVKNKEGEDSPKTARNLFMKQNKIQMQNPIVEMDGDEMTRIIWKRIKELVIEPFVDLKTEYYDLSVQNRDATDDVVTSAAGNATKIHKVAVKCATITPNAARVEEFGLKKMWKSPNATIRSILGGTVFRSPIIVDGVEPYVKCWKKPITIARHAYGDIYAGVEAKAEKGSVAKLVIEKPDGTTEEKIIKEFTNSSGIVMSMHNLDDSIRNFAKACFEYALSVKQDLWFSAKDTISKTYDHNFKDIFQEVYDSEYKTKFEAAGINYFYTLVDDAIARVMKSEGGFVWATKNYDGDVFSDMLASSFGSLSMMTSVLVSPEGYFEYEAAHGTIPRHYHRYLAGEKTSTNPVATLFAWTGALRKRGELDGQGNLVDFADRVENAVTDLIAEGYMTGDLALITTNENAITLTMDEFLEKVAERIY